MSSTRPAAALFDLAVLRPALVDAVVKLRPAALAANPVIFVTAVGAVLTTIAALRAALIGAPWGFFAHIALWLWFTVYFANVAEAVAEGRGKARADALRRLRADAPAKRLVDVTARIWEGVGASQLNVDDLVLVEPGDVVPADGEAVDGVASVDESAITGESAPVIRESGGDRSAVTGGSRLLSDWLVVRVTQPPGAGFLDRMIALVEGAKRRKTPNELALSALLAAMTLVFLIAVVTLWPLAAWSGVSLSVPALIALLVTLIPTTIGGLMSAIGVAGMDRLARFNLLAASGRAVEAAGDVDALLLDKTGTITFGNRMAAAFVPAPGVSERALAEAAMVASLSDETPEGRSVVTLAQERFGFPAQTPPAEARAIPFSAHTRLSGVDLPSRSLRKGAVDAVVARLPDGRAPREALEAAARIARGGGTPLAVSEDERLLGIIHLKDVIKPGVKERFGQLRTMGVRTVMVTGDNKLTAAAIAAEAGVDDFIAEATPEDKLRYIRAAQAEGRMVAMCGDGANDAPALAQADVGVAMQTGTQAAREAGNMIDLDSDPTKLIEVVHIGKQLLMTRGALTTFSIANDVAKYFAILPAMFLAALPELGGLNVMGLTSPDSAILSAVIFNALIIIALIPLALQGAPYRPMSAATLLRRNLLIYGLGGLIAPFIGVKLIDMALTAVGLA